MTDFTDPSQLCAVNGSLQPGMPPAVKLRVLHLEDNDEDHALVAIHLRRGGINADIQRVENEAEFCEALHQEWDLILSDYNLPGYSGLEALELVRRERPRWPRVLLSGDASSLPPGCDAVVLDKGELSRLPALVAALAAPSAR